MQGEKMIQSFADKGTEDIYHGINSKKARALLPKELHHLTHRKFDMLDAANTIEDLPVPPGNNLEALLGELKGFHSIRINKQWRIIFRWGLRGSEDVKFIDYH